MGKIQYFHSRRGEIDVVVDGVKQGAIKEKLVDPINGAKYKKYYYETVNGNKQGDYFSLTAIKATLEDKENN